MCAHYLSALCPHSCDRVAPLLPNRPFAHVTGTVSLGSLAWPLQHRAADAASVYAAMQPWSALIFESDAGFSSYRCGLG